MGKQDLSKQMPDTPWHIGYAKKEEDDPRRHKGRCIYLHSKICYCNLCETYLLKCPTSSHCKYYAETLSQDESNKFLHKTADEEIAKRAEKYKGNIRTLRKNLLIKNKMEFSNLNFDSLIKCPVCNEKLFVHSAIIKHCNYCGASYKCVADVNCIEESGCDFIIKKSKKQKINQEKTVVIGSGACDWMKKKCTNKNSPSYGHRCTKCELHSNKRFKKLTKGPF